MRRLVGLARLSDIRGLIDVAQLARDWNNRPYFRTHDGVVGHLVLRGHEISRPQGHAVESTVLDAHMAI